MASESFLVAYTVTIAGGTVTVGAAAFTTVTLVENDAVDDILTQGEGVVVLDGGAPVITGAYAGATVNIGGIDYPLITDGGTIFLLGPGNQEGASLPATQETYTLCFARGTRIATPAGEAAVESLVSGDRILTADGRAVAVRWIGRQTRHPRFGDLPVRISAGALGDQAPVRDLYVSPRHALLVDGLLVNAQALVNGRTIVQMTEWAGNVEYFHVETEAHEIILADGAPAETFIDNAERKEFDNYAEFAALYPQAPEMEQLPIGRVQSPRQLPVAIRARLGARADELMGAEVKAA